MKPKPNSPCRKLASLALTLAMALTLTVPALAYIPEGKPRPDPTPGQLPGKFNSTWSIDDPYWYTHGYNLGDYQSVYTNPNGPAQVYVPDEVQYLTEIENNNMTSINLPKHILDYGVYANIDQCTEIIIRGLTKEDLISKPRLFRYAPAKAAPIKNESGEILGWIGGDRSNYDGYKSDRYPTVIGGWRLVNMVDQPTDLDTAETVVISDGVKGIHKGSNFNYNKLGIDELKNSNMKVLSVPAGFRTISWRSFDDVPHQLTKIIYRGTEEDLIAEYIRISVQFDSYDIRPLSAVIPVEDESGNILGWVGGEYGTDIGGPKKLNLASNKPKQPDESIVVSFADVKPTDWYADAVTWAVRKNITSGYDSNTFAPKDTCTNVQIVAFLHRAAGSPAVSSGLPFSPDHAWATDALKWAYSKRIIDDDFKENLPCDRVRAVTYIWKAFDMPHPHSVPANNFPDTYDTGSVQQIAINWALEKGITSGTSKTTFSPYLECDRGTIVTLLYNAYNSK